jgi:hypothetical protein
MPSEQSIASQHKHDKPKSRRANTSMRQASQRNTSMKQASQHKHETRNLTQHKHDKQATTSKRQASKQKKFNTT